MSTTVQRRDRLIPWYFVAFFIVVAAVNAVLVTMAVRTHSGLVTDHPYERGLAYNTVVNAVAQQEALGWKGTISYSDGKLAFVLRSKNGQTIVPEQATASITRPTSEGMDFTVALTGQKTAITFPAKGVWDVRIHATHAGAHYQQSQRLVIP